MYTFYVGGIPLPVTPGKIQMDVNGRNKTVILINEGEVNLIKTSALTDISFECLIPQINKYPFARYSKGYKDAKYYLGHLEKLKNANKPFKFKITRKTQKKKILFETNMAVTLENYKIVEDSKNGIDLTIALELKQYREYGAKRAKILPSKDKEKPKVIVKKPRKEKEAAKSYTVKKGDTLGNIAKQQLKSTSRWREIYNLNKSVIESTAKKRGKASSSDGWWIWPGTVLKLPS